MKLIMAVSKDGFVARGSDDDMTWTGPIDKAVFKLLTSTSDVLAVSAKTLQYMPNTLPGRGKLYALSTDPRRGIALEDFAGMFPDAWLLGGQELGLYAMKNGFVNKAYICRVLDKELGIGNPNAIDDQLTGYLARRRYSKGRGSWWDEALRVKIDQSLVEVWERGSAVADDV